MGQRLCHGRHHHDPGLISVYVYLYQGAAHYFHRYLVQRAFLYGQALRLSHGGGRTTGTGEKHFTTAVQADDAAALVGDHLAFRDPDTDLRPLDDDHVGRGAHLAGDQAVFCRRALWISFFVTGDIQPADEGHLPFYFPATAYLE